MPTEVKGDAARLLEEADQMIRQQLAQAQAALAARGIALSPPLVGKARAQPAYRVFRHDGLGVHFVLRDTEEVPGHSCVFGPIDPQGRAVTFASAIAFANQAFAAWAKSYLTPPPEKFLAASAAELTREAGRLTELYARPPATEATAN